MGRSPVAITFIETLAEPAIGKQCAGFGEISDVICSYRPDKKEKAVRPSDTMNASASSSE
jgi:hypothetical protein